MSKHAKQISKPNARIILVALLALAFIAAFFGMLNVRANDTTTKPTQQVYGTTGQCAVNKNGDCTVNHGLGTKPTSVVVTPAFGGQQATVDPAKTTVTSFTVRFLWRDGTRFKDGTVLKYNVVYTYVGTTVPTTPPTTTTSPTVSPTPTVTPTTTPTNPAGACETPKYTTSVYNGSWMNPGKDNVQVNNNVWNQNAGWSQTLNACAWNNWSVIANQPGEGSDDGVKSYPDTQSHVNIPLTNVPTINSSWKVNTPAGGGTVPTAEKPGKQWNAAYDLWLDDYDYEVMIWTNWTANWQYWYGVYKGEKVTIDGVEYAAYHKAGTATDSAGIWFIRQDVTNEGNVNIDKLLKWAVAKGWIKTTSVLEEIEYGFEILYTGGENTRFDLLDHSVNVGTVPTPTPTATTTPAGYDCSPSGAIAHFYPRNENKGEGSDAIGDAPSTEKPGQYNISSEQWAVKPDYLSNLCAYSKDNWYVDIKASDDGDHSVQSYPSIRKIYHDWGNGGDFSGDPKLSSFPQLKVDVAHTSPDTCVGCIYEEAFDIWLNGIGGDKPELMIWTHNQGQTPYGNLKATNVTVDGRQWDYYNSGTYMAFVPHDKSAQLNNNTFDLKPFIAYVSSVVGTDPTVGQVSYGVEPVTTKGEFKRWTFSKFNVLDK